MRDAPPDCHIGFPLGLPPPDRDYMVTTTFFYRNLNYWSQNYCADPTDVQKMDKFLELGRQLLKWFKFV